MNSRLRIALSTGLFLLVFGVDRGSQLTMLSRRKTLVLGVDEMVRFDCRFEASDFNLFDYPVLWRKVQDVETTQVNIMGNINEPFISTGRYEVFFEQNATIGIYNLGLSIVETSVEDSGNYTCEVRGPHSVILGNVTHFLYIRDGVKRVVITEDNFAFEGRSSVGLGYNETSRAIHLVENTPTFLRCLVVGGYPPPTVHLYLGQRDVTERFGSSRAVTLYGEPGLRRICVHSERKTFNYRPTSDEDGVRLQCIASVPDMKSYNDYVHITVDYSPKMTCAGAEAHLGERNVILKCEIRAKPSLIRTHWVVDRNGTKLSEEVPTDRNGDFNIVTAVRSDGVIETQLVVRQVRKEFFRNFSVFAQNRISGFSAAVILSQKHSTYRGRDAQHDASRRRSSFSFDPRHPATSGATSPSAVLKRQPLLLPPHSPDLLLPLRHRLTTSVSPLTHPIVASVVILLSALVQ